jgi:AcrR family transcriptional regulator
VKRSANTQQERLVAAIVHVCAERGYEATTIARIISHAGVSRPTFYDYFTDKADCLLAALQDIERHALATVTRSVGEQPSQRAASAGIAALVAFAQEQPAQARLLMSETMAAGTPALDARDRSVEAIARVIENAHGHARAPTTTAVPPCAILVGAAYRLLASRLRRGERGLGALQSELLAWLASYEDSRGQQAWPGLTSALAPARPPLLRAAPLRAPPAPAPGRPPRSSPAVSENHRLRILFATAEVLRQVGYAQATVASITDAAGVDGRAFYKLFKGKQDAFTAVHEFAFQNAMAVTASAFFAVEEWPQRIWEAALAYMRYLEQNPALAHASLIEGHAGAPQSVQRFEELQASFTIFLQEGYHYQAHRQESAPSRVALEAIAHANFELLYRCARNGEQEMKGLVARLVYLCLAPFVGTSRTSELIEQISDERRLRSPAPPRGTAPER